MRYRYYTLFGFILICLFSCQKEASKSDEPNSYHLVPQPNVLKEAVGAFQINAQTVIVTDAASRAVADYLKAEVNGFQELQLLNASEASNNRIELRLDTSLLAVEGYQLSVTSERIELKAKQAAGLFYGIQTLRQLLTEKGAIPAVTIEDAPRFAYRGMLLDVGRHFFDVKAVKNCIDQLAYHKMNRLHWHLTEDQGWRIEIKKYPRLQEVAAYREQTLIGHLSDENEYDGKRYGGYYTQAEIKEVVDYAAKRFITIIPEIELPGHAQAAIAAYPNLGCTGEQLSVKQEWGVSQNVYCPKEETFEFLENVLTEVMALFPSEYIHIGGDECPKSQWEESAFCQKLIRKEGLKDEHELQSYFIQRIERFLNKNGRQIIGWDEILEGGLAPNATVMSWRGMEGGIEAAKAKHQVIMTPTSHCYFDYYQSRHPDEPLAIGGFLPLEKAYNLEPIPEELSTEEAEYILGAQANLWTEYIATPEQLEYMMFPRLSALSEVVWSPRSKRDFDGFLTRLLPHMERMENMGIKVARHFYDLSGKVQVNSTKLEAKLDAILEDAQIHYTLDGSKPTLESPRYEGVIDLTESATLHAQAFKDRKAVGRGYTESVEMHLGVAKPLKLRHDAHERYTGGGRSSLVNGITASATNFKDGNWIGIEGEDLEAIIDFGQATAVKSVALRFFKGEKSWIYLPQSIEILASKDGDTFESITNIASIDTEGKVAAVKLPLEVATRYLKVKAKNHGTIEKGKAGEGNSAWLFVDEIQVN